MNDQAFVRWDDEKIFKMAKELRQAEQVLVGIGAGFPMAAGVRPLPLDHKVSAQEYWPYWLPYIEEQRLGKEVPALYTQLAELLDGKDYFIIDANPDGYLYHAGVDAARIYKAQGDLARVQCSKNCQNHAWIGKQYFDQVREDSTVIPKCPHCGEPLMMNVYTGKEFCAEPYREKSSAYFRFINGSSHNRLAVLELGVGYSMPELIRFPFEQIVLNHKKAKLLRINTVHPLCVEENRHRALCAEADLAVAIPELLKQKRR